MLSKPPGTIGWDTVVWTEREPGRTNPYLAESSFFPSNGAVNPALTAMANAMRVGAHASSG